jgi:tRNA 2-thiouridine synthesizing protein A
MAPIAPALRFERRDKLACRKYYHGAIRATGARAPQWRAFAPGAAAVRCGAKRPAANGSRRTRPASLQWRLEAGPFFISWRRTEMDFDKDLDARGLNCPLPILRAKKALTEMQSGQVLRIVSTDLGSVKDFQAFCKQTGNELLTQSEASNEYTFFLKRK